MELSRAGRHGCLSGRRRGQGSPGLICVTSKIGIPKSWEAGEGSLV